MTLEATAPSVERAIPVLTVLNIDAEISFYQRLGFDVQRRYDDAYVALIRGDIEIHLSYWEDHDPRRTAGVVSLRVNNAQAIYDNLVTQLERVGSLFLFPAHGPSPELWTDLESRIAAGTPTIRVHEIEDKPWGLRQFSVIDVSGNALRVGTPIPSREQP